MPSVSSVWGNQGGSAALTQDNAALGLSAGDSLDRVVEQVEAQLATQQEAVEYTSISTLSVAALTAAFTTADGAQPGDRVFAQDTGTRYVMSDGAADALDVANWEVAGSVAIGRGAVLPADNSQYSLFVIEASPSNLPSGLYFFLEEGVNQWFQS